MSIRAESGKESADKAGRPAPGDDAEQGALGTGENICPECGGSGRLENRPCPNCNGTGKVVEGIGGG